MYIRIFPDKPISKKPAETRMGKGKGNPEEWVAVVKPGRVMYELEGVAEEVAREAFRLAHHKLPLATRVRRRGRRCYEDRRRFASEPTRSWGRSTRQLQEDLYKLRVQKATNQLENTNASRQMRKDLARVDDA